MTISDRMDDNLSVLAADAVEHPERATDYIEFLLVANKAAREGNPHQRARIRALAAKRLLPAQYVIEINQIMGWAR